MLHYLDQYGPGVGLPPLREAFPMMTRAELDDLLRRAVGTERAAGQRDDVQPAVGSRDRVAIRAGERDRALRECLAADPQRDGLIAERHPLIDGIGAAARRRRTTGGDEVPDLGQAGVADHLRPV